MDDKLYERILEALEKMANRPQPDIHVHVHTITPEQVEKLTKLKRNKNTMDAEGAHEGHVIDPMSKYPRPYVG